MVRRCAVAFTGLAAVLAFVLFGTGFAFAEDKAPKNPKIEVSPPSFDFGTVDEGATPKAVFLLKNSGSADLIIYDAKPSCGCTVAKISNKNIAPGETATVEAVYNSHNASGPQHKSVTVMSNDPANPSVVLSITGTVKAPPAPEIALSEYLVQSLELPKGGNIKRDIKITNVGQLDLTINEVQTSPGIKAALDKCTAEPGKTSKLDLLLKPGETRVMEITIMPRTTAGNFVESAYVHSNAKRMPLATFTAQGTAH